MREIKYIIETKSEGTYGIEGIHHALSRLKEFLGMDEAYFLFSNVKNPHLYEISAKASSDIMSVEEQTFSIKLDVEVLGIQDRISVFELVGNEKYSKIVEELRANLTHVEFKNIWLGSCPLPGVNNAVWLFINVLPRASLRRGFGSSSLDKRFLARFCVATHDIVAREFASSMVMRNIGHELGAGIQSVISKEERISRDTTDKTIRECALRNITQMEKYHCLVENLRSLFIRRERGAYIFDECSLRKPVMETFESCLYDDEVERRHIELREPILKGKSDIEMHVDSIKMAIFNLVQNAIKYSFRDHFVAISGEGVETLTGRRLYRLKISNFGVGITSEEIDRRLIFKENYRGILSRDRNRTGTGLGLAIVDRIINIHSGHVVGISISAEDLKRKPGERPAISQKDIERITAAGKNLKMGFFTVFTVDLPYTQKENNEND